MEIAVREKKRDVVRTELIRWLDQMSDGTKLPSEKELSLHFGVSRRTIRDAVDVLVNESLIARVQGSGMYANKPKRTDRKTVSLIFQTAVNPADNMYLSVIWQRLELELSRWGWSLTTVSVRDDVADLSFMLREADALVFANKVSAAVLPDDKPSVVLLDPGYWLPKATYILIDDYHGSITATDHLVSLGHTKLAFVGDVRFLWAIERYRGACACAAEHNLAAPLLFDIDSDQPLEMSLVEDLRRNGVTGVVCTNDIFAMGLISTLHKAGVRVPEEMSVIGFDDLPHASCFHPALTTIKSPIQDVVATAVDELRKQMASPESHKPKRIILPIELVVRDSTGRIE